MTEQLNELLEISRTARKHCKDLLNSFTKSAKGERLYVVQLAILSRIISSQTAIEILLEHGLHAEAAIIALTQFELRLDILYIGNNVNRATEWMEHSSKTRQPWAVKHKIEEVYAHNSTFKESQHNAFKVLSQVKHGNPVAGWSNFYVSIEDQLMTIGAGPVHDSESRFYSLLLYGLSIFQLFEAIEGSALSTRIDNGLRKELLQLKLRAVKAFAR